MRKSGFVLFVGLTAGTLPASPLPEKSSQLILVLTDSPDAATGILYQFERDGREMHWHALGGGQPVTVGKNGLASGRGLHSEPVSGLAAKGEGDGKSPAGVFALTAAFGFDEKAREMKMPYVRVTDDLECVDDPSSIHYNKLVERRRVANVDWKTSERMREIPEYRWGVVVAHNAEPARPGEGSCIFLHAWSSPESPTVGCTAMRLDDIFNLVFWLDPEASPVLVQLTRDAYQRLRESWKLPRL